MAYKTDAEKIAEAQVRQNRLNAMRAIKECFAKLNTLGLDMDTADQTILQGAVPALSAAYVQLKAKVPYTENET